MEATTEDFITEGNRDEILSENRNLILENINLIEKNKGLIKENKDLTLDLNRFIKENTNNITRLNIRIEQLIAQKARAEAGASNDSNKRQRTQHYKY